MCSVLKTNADFFVKYGISSNSLVVTCESFHHPKSHMKITHWPLEERPRERLLQLGPKALSTAELLAIFLRTGVPGKTALDISRDLLTKFGSLRALMEAPQKELCKQSGLGTAKYTQLQAALELSCRYMYEDLQKREALTCAQETKAYLVSQLRHQKREVFACLFLNNRNQILKFEELFRGSVSEAMVYPREIIKRALQLNASGVILSHNHPLGSAKPSPQDQELTHTIKKLLNAIDVRLLDHLVIGENDVSSFAEMGLLQ